jgi:hypothetical protein
VFFIRVQCWYTVLRSPACGKPCLAASLKTLWAFYRLKILAVVLTRKAGFRISNKVFRVKDFSYSISSSVVKASPLFYTQSILG